MKGLYWVQSFRFCHYNQWSKIRVPKQIQQSHDDVIKWKHFLRYWPFVRGIHRSPVNSPHKGQWLGALMSPLISAWINGRVNNYEAGDLRLHRANYDAIVMRVVLHTLLSWAMMNGATCGPSLFHLLYISRIMYILRTWLCFLWLCSCPINTYGNKVVLQTFPSYALSSSDNKFSDSKLLNVQSTSCQSPDHRGLFLPNVIICRWGQGN